MTAWQQLLASGRVRPVDAAFARVLLRQTPQAHPLALAGAALASQALAQGHAAFDGAALVRDLGKRLWNVEAGAYASWALLFALQFTFQAKRAQIDPARVRAGSITLNHDGGRWLSLGLPGDLPAVVREVNGQWQRQ